MVAPPRLWFFLAAPTKLHDLSDLVCSELCSELCSGLCSECDLEVCRTTCTCRAVCHWSASMVVVDCSFHLLTNWYWICSCVGVLCSNQRSFHHIVWSITALNSYMGISERLLRADFTWFVDLALSDVYRYVTSAHVLMSSHGLIDIWLSHGLGT